MDVPRTSRIRPIASNRRLRQRFVADEAEEDEDDWRNSRGAYKFEPATQFPDAYCYKYLAAAGLAPLVATSYRFINKNMVSAFVEIWQPETNTFHMPFGEITITLDDVSTILGISLIGKSLSVEQQSFKRTMTLVEHGLGVTSQQAHEELAGVRGSSVRLEWLRDLFGDMIDADPEEHIRHAARAYLLYILGCTLFTGKSGTRVPVIYLKLLMNFDEARTYAWGATALAYLYRQLGFVTRSGVRQIAGYLTLLEAWIYEHFPKCRPNPTAHTQIFTTGVHRWVLRRESGDQMSNLQSLREALDDLGAHEVVWDPYQEHMADHPFHELHTILAVLSAWTSLNHIIMIGCLGSLVGFNALALHRAIRGATAN
ncbi:serine/threonine-protein phosphatase 7 long form isoform X1 [Cinnamomum micranthum f. kanehirae]|uniref:Serine/threonine-protein phosphatase 7 long form isoform X1 n=1 Tax=Cinnamomum micranthum f. kanehirae TaxID=337451 RepID=A0A3S3R116_9MAGN|nr:serine/threonine-protein phosphatase 7 long form isoform X1 [Cinnamomum micranthum f. kanehirae]